MFLGEGFATIITGSLIIEKTPLQMIQRCFNILIYIILKKLIF